MMSVPPINSPFIRIPLIAVALLFAIWSGMTGIAAIDYFRTQSYLEAWAYQSTQNPAYKIPDADFQDALADAEQGVQLIPYNSDYHVALADILTKQFTSSANLSAETRQLLATDIVNHYRIGIKQRPSWPYTQAQFAMTKIKLGQIDQEMMLALQKANALGPREVDIIHNTISIGLSLWDQLDHNTQLTVVSAIDRSLSWDLGDELNAKESLYAISFIGLFHRQAEVCPLLRTKNDNVTSLCRTITAPNSTKAHT